MTASPIEVQGIPIAYEVRGEGSPILLIHGWSADRDYMLADLEPIFAEHPGWRRIYLDLPGHGATPAPEWLSTEDQMLAILCGFIAAVLPDGRFALAGSSYGGRLAVELVRLIPGRLEGAGLLVPAVAAPDGSLDPADHRVFLEDPSVFDESRARRGVDAGDAGRARALDGRRDQGSRHARVPECRLRELLRAARGGFRGDRCRRLPWYSVRSTQSHPGGATGFHGGVPAGLVATR